MSEADVIRLHRELQSARERADLESSRLEDHTETVRRISVSIDQHLDQISRFAGAGRNPQSDDEGVLATLTRLRHRSNDVRNDLDRRRREAGLVTMETIDSHRVRRVSRPQEETADDSRRNSDSGSGSETVTPSIRPPTARSGNKKTVKILDVDEERPRGLRPVRFVSLQERLVIGAPPPKGQKRPATEDATVRVRVLRKKAGLKAR